MNLGTDSADTIEVSSLAALQEAIHNVEAGDNIILSNGSYETSEPIRITPQGTASKPIIISAESIGGVTITGASGFSILRPSRYVIVKGFVFKHAADSSARI